MAPHEHSKEAPEFRFVVKVQRELVQQDDVLKYLIYSEGRAFEMLIPAGLNATLDEACAAEAKYFCYAEVTHASHLRILTRQRPEVPPLW